MRWWLVWLQVIVAPGCGVQTVVPELDGGEFSSAGTLGTTTETSFTSTSSVASTSTTSATSGASDSSTSTSEGGTCPSVDPEDWDPRAASDVGTPTPECKVWEQGQCADDHKCTAYGSQGTWTGTRCVPVACDPKPPGSPCTVADDPVSGVDDCQRGSMCWDVDPMTLQGICVELCQGSYASPTCPTDHACLIANEGVLNLCLPICDPVVQDCPNGQSCLPGADTFICLREANPGTGEYASPCTGPSDCAAAYRCLPAADIPDCTNSASCCTPLCHTTAADPCPGQGQTCLQEQPPPATHPDLGLCAIP